jgi:hypothetical protein
MNCNLLPGNSADAGSYNEEALLFEEKLMSVSRGKQVK